MKSLIRSYNRTYYRKLFLIQCGKHWKLFKVDVIGMLFKLCYKIDEEITKRILNKLVQAEIKRLGYND